MPDLFAHFASGYLPASTKPGLRFDALLAVGAILPDVLTRIPEIVLYRIGGFELFHFFNALHTPVGFGLSCYLLCLFFAESERKTVFFSLLAGCILHQMLDLLQFQLTEGGYLLLFPFSLTTAHWGLFHYNASVELFPILLIMVMLRMIVTR